MNKFALLAAPAMLAFASGAAFADADADMIKSAESAALGGKLWFSYPL